MSKKKLLTEFVTGGGWASKLGPGVLSNIISALPKQHDPMLIVGFDTTDDACVYRINSELAMIQTVDFFPPMVDDPYMFGQIAAANSFSDIYAMGAEPCLALNLLCVNMCMGDDAVKEILRGGADQAIKAGCIISGGHTIEDSIPKYGLSVTGFAHPDKILKNVGALPGDVLILTKPLGVGILLTALKGEFIEAKDLKELFDNMIMLNKEAASALSGFNVHACTDITGFGLLGHTYELAYGSNITVSLFASKLPILPMTEEMALYGMVPSAAYRNYEYIKPYLEVSKDIDQWLIDVVADPQTSGGLLIAIPEEEAYALLRKLNSEQVDAYIIGKVSEKDNKYIKFEL